MSPFARFRGLQGKASADQVMEMLGQVVLTGISEFTVDLRTCELSLIEGVSKKRITELLLDLHEAQYILETMTQHEGGTMPQFAYQEVRRVILTRSRLLHARQAEIASRESAQSVSSPS